MSQTTDLVDALYASDAASALTNKAAREIERLRAREAHLLSVIRGYNPDDALFDHEKETHRVG